MRGCTIDRWKKRHNIRQVKVSGESGEVSGVTVNTWLERIPELVSEYAIADIWNLNETGVFWTALPEQRFGQKGKECRGGKKSETKSDCCFNCKCLR